jgi:hypothetical protein
LSSILYPSLFRLICRHFNGSPILCQINATSSCSYVFRLQYPRVLHCRIDPIEKLKTLGALERKKTSHNKFRIIKQIIWKSRVIFAKIPCGYLTGGGGGGRIFSRNVCSPTAIYKIDILYLLYFYDW